MSKRWKIDDDLFLVRFQELGADFIASHDLGFHGKGAGERRIAKLKYTGVYDLIIAAQKADTEMRCAHTLAFGPEWAKEIAASELSDLKECAL